MTQPRRSAFREYENGVADVLGFLAGAASVTRNTHIYGTKSQSPRQVDVLVEGDVLGKSGARLLVDCKRWNRRVDLPHMGSFIDLVHDTEVDFGIIVSVKGASKVARRRAEVEQGIQVKVMSLEELEAWKPIGTVQHSVRIAVSDLDRAFDALRRSGFRAAEDASAPHQGNDIVLQAFRHYGTPTPTAETQALHTTELARALVAAHIPFAEVAHGVVIVGGTPSARWLRVTVAGVVSELRVLAETEADVNPQLERIAALRGIAPELMGVEHPDGWPNREQFGLEM